MTDDSDVKDLTIIGAGPTGLFGAFYAGMRGATCRLVDALNLLTPIEQDQDA